MAEYFGQRDSRWKDTIMGFGSSSIGNVGCYLTSLCNGLNAKGYSFDVASLNTKFKSVPAFPDIKQGAWIGPYQNYIDVQNLSKYYSDIFISFQQIDPWGIAPTTADLIRPDMIALGRVSAVPIGGTGDHFVLITGQQNGVAMIHDPWSNTEEPITKRWGNYGYVLGLRLFNVKPYVPAPIITEQTKIPQIVDANGNPMEVQAIRGTLSDLRRDLTNCQTGTNNAIISALSKNNIDWQTKMTTANQTVDSLNLQIVDLKKSIAILQQAIQDSPQPSVDSKKIIQVHDIIWGSGFWWTKFWAIKSLLPK